jgi:selenocysteine lyase/cysteine desulfurase
MSADWEAVRAQFPALSGWTYLNTATFGQLPRAAVEAAAAHFAHRDELACADFLTWFDDHDRLRAKLARLINATPEDIAYFGNASSALALLLNGLDWRLGDEIVTLAGEFPNQIYAPAARRVRLVEAPWPELLGRIGPRTRLVAVSTVNYTTGLRPDLRALVETAHAARALVYLDGTQSLGALEFDWQAIGADMLAVNGYKWMLAPNGAAFAAISPALRERIAPQVVGWRSHKDWRNVDHLHHGPPEFVGAAERYEGGMLPSALLYAMEASVDLMLALTPAAIERRVLELAAAARALLEDAGAELACDGPSPILAARFPRHDASALARALRAARVIVSARHGYLRVSTHFYNNEADLAALAAALLPLLAAPAR